MPLGDDRVDSLLLVTVRSMPVTIGVETDQTLLVSSGSKIALVGSTVTVASIVPGCGGETT